MAVFTALCEAKALLLRSKELSGEDIENLNTSLHRLKVQELKMLAEEVLATKHCQCTICKD